MLQGRIQSQSLGVGERYERDYRRFRSAAFGHIIDDATPSAGGIDIVTDNQCVANTEDPCGHCEFERVKTLKADASWLPDIRGKVVKMVSQLLYDLPATERYKVIFIESAISTKFSARKRKCWFASAARRMPRPNYAGVHAAPRQALELGGGTKTSRCIARPLRRCRGASARGSKPCQRLSRRPP